MADKVYIPNLVVNEISEDLIDEVANKISEKKIFANLNTGNTFNGDNLFAGRMIASRVTTSKNPDVMEPKEWAALGDNEVPTKKQILDNVQGGTVDTANLAKLDQGNTFTGTQTFTGMVSFNQEVSVGDIKFYGNNNFYSNSIFGGPVVVTNQQPNQELAITPIANGVSINLGDDCTLTMNAKMISELKRLLGIQ